MPARPLPTIAGVTRVTFRGSNVAGQQWANVMHFKYTGGAGYGGLTERTQLDAKLIRLYSGTAYSTGVPWLTHCTADTKLIDCTMYPLDGTSGPTTFSHTNPGTAPASTNQAAEVAHVLTLRTGTRGRRYRGRIYLPAVSTTFMTGASGGLLSTANANFLVQARGLLADLPAGGWEWHVASYGHGTDGNVATSWSPFSTLIAELTMDAIPDVQRRRKQ